MLVEPIQSDVQCWRRIFIEQGTKYSHRFLSLSFPGLSFKALTGPSLRTDVDSIQKHTKMLLKIGMLSNIKTDSKAQSA